MTRLSSGRRKLLTASDQLRNSEFPDYPELIFQLFSLRLRNLHFTMNRILIERIRTLESENSELRRENGELQSTNQFLESWKEELTPLELDGLGRVELPLQSIQKELEEGKRELDYLRRWILVLESKE